MKAQQDEIDRWIATLEQMRDELKLKKHLLAMDAADTLGQLEDRLERAERRYRQDPIHPGTVAETLHELHESFAALRQRLTERRPDGR